MLFPFALASSLKYLAADVPVMPVPTITISASEGSSSVVRCPSKNSFGSVCQNEFDEVGVGREARGCFMVLIVNIEVGCRLRSANVSRQGYISIRFVCYETVQMRCDYMCAFARNEYVVQSNTAGLTG
jgi:hypothetical protein